METVTLTLYQFAAILLGLFFILCLAAGHWASTDDRLDNIIERLPKQKKKKCKTCKRPLSGR